MGGGVGGVVDRESVPASLGKLQTHLRLCVLLHLEFDRAQRHIYLKCHSCAELGEKSAGGGNSSSLGEWCNVSLSGRRRGFFWLLVW